MLSQQEKLHFSDHSSLYDILVKKDNMLRKMNELIDFSFVRDELKNKYSPNNGRIAEDPVRLFKYLLLKTIAPVSDVDLVKRSYTDMSYKYFLGLSPEDDVIDPSLLTKFRRQRLKDTDLLDLLISKTVAIAINKGIIRSRSSIIVDATHTLSSYNRCDPMKFLIERVGKLIKVCSSFYNDSLSEQDLCQKQKPKTYSETLNYCNTIADTVENSGMQNLIPGISEALNMLREGLDDVKNRLVKSKDEDARIGYKSTFSPFFGYKSHLGMTPEGVITSAVVTSGEKSDGKVLTEIIERSKGNGVEVSEVIGDTAYSGKDNIKYCDEKEINLVSPLNPVISNGIRKGKEFEYNKDAGMFVCPAGHLATRKKITYVHEKNKNDKMVYFFDVNKCKCCPLREGCYKDGAKKKTYIVRIISDEHKRMMEYEKSQEFKIKMKERYRIEEKNAELKNVHGLKKTISYGINSMEMQTAMAIFVVNIKKIMNLGQ